MYTRTVRLRHFAFLLGVLLAATPLLGVVCQMDCDPPPAISSECHQSAASPEAATVHGARHGCDHDHTIASPAVRAGTNARDSVGSVIAISVPTVAQASVTDARVAILDKHGPPGLSGRSTASHNTILRI